jgi:hypothetical protein
MTALELFAGEGVVDIDRDVLEIVDARDERKAGDPRGRRGRGPG